MAAESRGGVTSGARPRRRKQRATAVRQALSLCEAELLRLAWDGADVPQSSAGLRSRRPRVSVVTTRAALRAAGIPPHMAAALRSRLRLIPDAEDTT